MAKKVDLRSIKVLPYALLAVFVTTLFDTAGTVFDVQAIDFNLMADVLVYDSVLVVFFCVYRLSEAFDWFRYANAAFMSYILASLFDNLMVWIYQLSGGEQSFLILSYVLSAFPDICLLLAVAFVIKCISNEYKAMDSTDKVERTDKMLRLWIIAQMVNIFIIDVSLPIHHLMSDSIQLMSYVIIACSALLYIATAAFNYIGVKNFCYDYYMYTYNRGKR
ncbi:MAG: hypothetical protein K5656_01580 [Lachnospiraceae bacterium]|nr:hypothetical protein [Lachnospiraceae bacterium]